MNQHRQPLSLWIFGALVLASLSAWPGGKSSNGNGGTKKNSAMNPGNLIGLIFAARQEAAIADQTKEWARERGEELMKCPLSQRQYPKLPEELASRMQLLIEVSDGPQKAGAVQQQGRRTRLAAVTSRTLCLASSAALDSYKTLILALYPKGTKLDEIISTLLDESGAIETPITIILREKAAEIPARGRPILESSWFDHETGEISWSQPPLRTGFLIEGGRSPTQILRHELTHVFLKRQLGDEYPKDEAYWHDTRYLEKMHEEDNPGASLYAFKFETSETAAFIEGFAYAMEGIFREEHLWVSPMKNVFGILSHDDRACYFYQDLSWVKDKGARFQAPVKSEVYVGSTLLNLLVREHLLGEGETYGASGPGTVITRPDLQRVRQMLKAFKVRKPLQVGQLVEDYDRLQGSVEGWLWLREFYFSDYKEGPTYNTAQEFQLIPRDTKDDFFLPEPFDICVRDPKNNNFFSPLKDAQENELRSQSREVYARTVDATKLRTEAEGVMKKAVETAARFDAEILPMPEAARVQKEIVAPYPALKSDLLMGAIIESEIDRDIYQDLEKIAPTYLMAVHSYFEAAVGLRKDSETRDGDILIVTADIEKILKSIADFITNDLSEDPKVRQTTIEKFNANKNALEGKLSNLGQLIAMSKVLKGDPQRRVEGLNRTILELEAARKAEAAKKTAEEKAKAETPKP
jgi:hypothetical protein